MRLDVDEVARVQDAKSTGQVWQLLAATPGAKVSVTGSSLGGHLAMAFAGLFPAAIDQAVAFNSPGIVDNSTVRSLFAALGGTVPAAGDSRITNVVSSEANNAGDQLDIIAGYPGGNFPGTKITIPIENQFASDVLDPKIPSWNHDQRQVTDALAVFGMLERLDPTMTLQRFDRLLRVAANGERRSLENLVDMVESMLGIDQAPLPAGNSSEARDALHRAVQGLVGGAPQSPEPAAVFQALAGKVRLEAAGPGLAVAARSDFQSFVALQLLSPFVLDPVDAAGVSALDDVWRSAAWAPSYEEWVSDQQARQRGGQARHYSDAYLADRQALLNQAMAAHQQYAVANPDGYLPVGGTGRGSVNTRFVDGVAGLWLQVNDVAVSPSTAPNKYVVFGGAAGDVLAGAAEGDHLYGGAGNDTLTGHGGDDHLDGGSGDDRYVFADSFGVDMLNDVDGWGTIELDGQVLTGGHSAGAPRLWLGADDTGHTTRYVVRNHKDSATGQQLVIARAGDPSNTITVNDFDLAAATSAAGYLGIRLDNTQRLVIAENTGTGAAGAGSPFEAWDFDPDSVTGQTMLAEGGAGVYTLFLRSAAAAGDTITLALSGLQDKFLALIGRTRVNASGAVIALEEGQTQVSFGLLQDGEVVATSGADLSAAYSGAGGATESNTWTLAVQDAGVVGQTLVGDQTYQVGNSSTAIVRDGRVVVTQGGATYLQDASGNLVAGAGAQVGDNVLYGSDAADRLMGMSGNDALDGGAGNDVLEGGDGDDLMAGGAGTNDLHGGAGNDFILGAGSLSLHLQQLGPDDTWQAPVGKTVLGRGATWGVVAHTDTLFIWEGATGSTAGSHASSIDAGDGDDHVIAGAGDDRIAGGAGHDHIDGMGGADVIDGGEGNDIVRADGMVLAAYLNTTVAAQHAADYVDAGGGDDNVQGGGGADVLFGGAGADQLFGDGGGGRTDDALFVPLQFHGADQIDGEEGDDYLEGGGGDDTLDGGAGADTLWGDTTADNIVGSADGQDAQALALLAFGDDTLAGGDGDDRLTGGGRDDILDGGDGNDALWGDESNTALAGELHGGDYLDGGLGDDILVGGGRGDTLLGGDGDDQLTGDDVVALLAGKFHGGDYLDGGAGNDVLLGGGAADVLFGGSGADTLWGDLGGTDATAGGFDGEDHLEGEDGDDRLFGEGADDVLIGGAGNDWLDGGAGADTMDGGNGDDSYVVDDVADLVREAWAAGNDTVTSSITLALPDNVENLLLVGDAALDGTGNKAGNQLVGTAGANVLLGLAGNDTLVGGAGADTLVGGPGDDIFVVDDAGDLVVETAGEGVDMVRSTVSLTLADHVEHLSALGAGHVDLTGNTLDNDLQGNSGNNVVRGGAGNDALRGGAGNDVYLFNPGDGQDTIDNTDLLRDTADANAPAGMDTVRLGAGIAPADVVGARVGDDLLLQLRGTTDTLAIAAYYAPHVTDGTRILDHKLDRVVFDNGVVWDQAQLEAVAARADSNRRPSAALAVPAQHARAGEVFSYTVAAGTITDPDTWDSVGYSLRGRDGANLPAWLSFDAATRTLTGIPGPSDVGDTPLVLWGTDMYLLAASVNMQLRVTDPLQLGTAGNDTMTGTAFNDILRGLGGNDLIHGGTGADLLDGGDGDDALFADSGSGPNSLTGGAGNDTLAAHRLAAGNRFEGGTGNDAVQGSAYDDTYHFRVGDGRDTLTETAPMAGSNDQLVFAVGITPADIGVTRSGEDMLFTHHNGLDQVTVKGWFTSAANWVESIAFADLTVWSAADLTAAALVVNGTAGDDTLVGTAMNDTLRGLAGNDTLSGGRGTDILEGGDGHDVLVAGMTASGSTNTVLLGGAGNDRMSADLHSSGSVFEGGTGDDLASGSGFRDTYRFGLGDGQDWITEVEVNPLAGRDDTLVFGPGIAPADIGVQRNNNDLIFAHANGTDQVTVGNWFASTPTFSASARQIEEIRFADGTVWSAPALTAAALVVRGTTANDFLTSSDMDDSMYGLGGNDRLSGGRGHNLLDGGDGDDVLVADDGKYTVTTFYNISSVVTTTTWGSNHLIGGAGDDTLLAAPLARDTVFEGGAGSDSVTGSAYNDTYRFDLGDGRDTLREVAPVAGHADTLHFGPGIRRADIGVVRSGDDLVLRHSNGQDQVRVVGWFADPGLRIETIDFADGTVWDPQAVAAALAIDQVGGAGADVLTGTSGPDVLQGLDGDDTLDGLAGNDGLQGGRGNDRLNGGAGNDMLTGDAAGEAAVSTVLSSLVVHARGSVCEGVWPTMEVWLAGVRVQSFRVSSATLAAYVVAVPAGASASSVDIVFTNDAYRPDLGQDRNLFVDRIEVNGRTFSASGAGTVLDFGTGAGAFDGLNTTVGYGTLASHAALRISLDASDQLDGGTGADSMAGGVGNDLYLVDDAGDTLLEAADSGHDIVRSTVSHTLSDNLEDLELGGVLAIDATGNAKGNTLRGNAAANRLDGRGGRDMLVGGAGDDTYGVDDVGDVVYEIAGGGVDTVESSVSFTLGNQVEHLVLTGTADSHGTGNGQDNTLTGNSGNNTLTAGAGDDILRGGHGNDRLAGSDGDDRLFGDAAGEATPEEQIGALAIHARGTVCEGVWPTMEVWLAGIRVQSFSVDSASLAPYVVQVPAGTRARSVDILFVNDAYRPDLGQDRNLIVDRIEVNGRSLGASGAGTVLDFGTGLAAFDGFNTTVGYGVVASHGALRIALGAGDQLDGGAGADTMEGGVGNDLYLVDNVGDVVSEDANAGHDIVRSTVSHALADNVEDLELGGVLAIDAVGNAAANTLRGNAAANRLDGGAGADMLVGGAGDDTYVVDNPGDVVYELAGGGVDTVQSAISYTLANAVEHLHLTGAAASNGNGNGLDNTLAGNAASNTLTGAAGNDTLHGGAGNDRLSGGDGDDILIGDAAGERAVQEAITSLVVVARGSVCEGVWPTMEVWLSGVKVQGFSVDSAALKPYVVTVPVGTSAASVDIVFANDAYRPDLGQDRNLYVDHIEVNGRTLAAAGAGTVLDFGSGAGAFDGINTTVGYGTLASHAALRIGLDANDHLDGGAGADRMAGGVGNDLYLVDNVGDVVTETAAAGHDIVRSTVSRTLSEHLEDLELLGTLPIDATGNATANTLRGNAAANRLDGGAAATCWWEGPVEIRTCWRVALVRTPSMNTTSPLALRTSPSSAPASTPTSCGCAECRTTSKSASSVRPTGSPSAAGMRVTSTTWSTSGPATAAPCWTARSTTWSTRWQPLRRRPWGRPTCRRLTAMS